MNILYVTTALLSHPNTGCMLRTFNICRQLAKCGRVTMLAVSHLFDESSVQLCKQEFAEFHQIKLKPYTAYPNPFGEIKRKWDMHWPFSNGIQADKAGQRLFADLLKANDIVWFHTLGASQPFGKQDMPASVMDLDDLNHCKFDMRARHDENLRFRLSATVQSYKWKHHEYNALREYDIIAVCSEYDKKYLAAENVRVVPNGFACPPQKPQKVNPDPNKIGFIGTLGYGPNHKGLIWFKDHVWPRILQKNPKMELRLIGLLPVPKYKVEAAGFTYLGNIENALEEIQTWSAMIVPILYGGGTRIKILDAFSKMCPVVSTTIGAQGIVATNQKQIVLADEPAQFADCCLELAANPERGYTIADAAWQLFLEKYTWDHVGESVCKIVNELTQKERH